MAFLSDEHFHHFFSLLPMWASCHRALQAFAFISRGSITESAAHLHASHSPPLRSGIKISTCVKKTKHLVLFDLKFHLPQSPSSFTSIITTFTSTPPLFQTSASLSLIHVCHFVYSRSYSMEWYRKQMQSSEWGRYRMPFPCVARKCKQPVLFTVVCSCSLLN